MAQQSELVPEGTGTPTNESVEVRAAAHRPGMVTFAAVVIFIVAGLEALTGLLAFMGTGWWVTSTNDLVYTNFVFWGAVDLIIAAIALYAGIDLLRGGVFGLGIGYLFTVLCAIRWLLVIPLCVMVIYGLTKYSEQLGRT